MLDELKAKLKEYSDERAKLLETHAKKGEEILEEGFKSIFDKYPELKSFSWRQYTPYFNDGDTCTFGVCECHEINDDEIPWRKESKEPWKNDAASDIDSLILNVGDEIMENIYGDHVRVTISKKMSGFKTDTETYDHD